MRQEDFFWNPNHKRARDDVVFDGEGPLEARRTRQNHPKAGDIDTFDGLIDFDLLDGQLYATGMAHSQSFGDLLDFTAGLAFEQSSVEEASICLRECVAGMDGKDKMDEKDGHVPQSSTGGSYVGRPNSEKGYGSDASEQTEAVDEGRFKLFSLVGYRKSMAMAANSKHVASGVPFVMPVDLAECLTGARDAVMELLSCF